MNFIITQIHAKVINKELGKVMKCITNDNYYKINDPKNKAKSVFKTKLLL